MTGASLLFLLLLFQVKHLLADFVMQSSWMVFNKGKYGHPAGFVHAGLHAALSLPILLISPVSGLAAVSIAAAEFVLHYHVDWGKDQVVRRYGMQPTEWRFWASLGVDQFLHQVTYVGMLMLILQLS